MKLRRVLIIPEYSRFGGTLSFLLRLIDIHVNNNIETALVIPEKQAFPNIIAYFKRYNARVYTTPNRTPFFTRPYVSLVYDILSCWKAYQAFQPNIIVVSNGTPSIQLGVLAYPVPVVFTIHTYPTSNMFTKKRFGMRLFVTLASYFNNRFTTVSHFSATNVVNYMGVPRKRIEVIYNSFRPIVPTLQAKQPIVLTIGHVEWYKNPEIWLQVAMLVLKQRPDVQFIWLGEGTLYDVFREKVCSLGLETHIVFHGYSDNVQQFLTKAMIYFQPSLLENHGISIVDAMACGLPCVASHVGGTPESVVDGETGFLCNPNDSETFSMKIVQLLNDPSLQYSMGMAGKQRAETLFSEVLQEQKILQLYNSLSIKEVSY